MLTYGEEKASAAKAAFAQGYNCAQAVFLSFCPETGYELRDAARLTNCLGGGFSQTGGICGAVSAAGLAISALFGRDEPSREGEQLARQQRTYRMVQDIQREFRERYGAIDCPALLERGSADSGEARNDKYNCPAYVGLAAELAANAIAAERGENPEGSGSMVGGIRRL